MVGDRTATLELGSRVIRDLQWGGDRIRVSFVLDMIAIMLAATRPDAAAIIQGAADAYVVQPDRTAQLVDSVVVAALGDEHARELRRRGADMDWDHALAYTLAQTSQVLNEPEP